MELLRDWANCKQASPAQVALAWLLAQKPGIVPIPGTTPMPHMLENIGAAAVSFSPGELLKEVGTALDGFRIRGERLPAAVLAYNAVEAPER